VSWEKGFKRLFTVAAIVWAGFCLLIAFTEKESNGEALVIMAVAVPAAAYFFLFKVLPWIGRGFKR
jgi:Na+/melibiose symporter-like transporter